MPKPPGYNAKYSKAFRERNPNYHRFSRYKITDAEYLALNKSQNGKCAICGGVSGNRTLAVDHSHTTGKIRGLLCQACNWALGLMKDDPETVFKAAVYLAERN